MNEIRVRKARLIAAEIRVPADRGIAHRAVLLASLANGPSLISGFPASEECMDTVRVCVALGARVEYLANVAGDPWAPDDRDSAIGPPCLRIHGTSMRWTPPAAALDCGIEATPMALLAGALAGQPFVSRISGGAAASRTALRRVREPLTAMGASFRTTGPDGAAPLLVSGVRPLQALTWRPPVTTADAKGAMLLAGLFASGKTTITEESRTCDHTERLLHHFQVRTRRSGASVSVYGGQVPESRDFHIPGDISYAANWIVAAAMQPGSDLVVRGTGLNDTRTGFLRVLGRMGARIREDIESGPGQEPAGTLMVGGAALRGTVIRREEIAGLADELPLLAVAAAFAEGTTIIPETPETAERLSRVEHNLRLMGATVASRSEALAITGSAGEPLQPGCVPSYGDPHIAMAFAVAGFFASGETIVEDIACLKPAWPEFADDVRHFQARSISEGFGTPVVSSAPPPRGDRARR